MTDSTDNARGPKRIAHPYKGPDLPTEVFADPGRHDWYFREKMPDSVARFVRADLAPDPLQPRVAPWMDACFGPEISGDKLERGDRFLEEALELLQSGGYPPERVAALTGYVFNREPGEPAQEVGGVMITLAAYCLAHGLDMHEAGETELARIWTKVDKIRAKPVGSALPIRSALEPCDPLADPRVVALVEALRQIADMKAHHAGQTPNEYHMQPSPRRPRRSIPHRRQSRWIM